LKPGSCIALECSFPRDTRNDAKIDVAIDESDYKRTTITFPSHGEELGAWLYEPKSPKTHKGSVIAYPPWLK
jgi:hypothetical protein